MHSRSLPGGLVVSKRIRSLEQLRRPGPDVRPAAVAAHAGPLRSAAVCIEVLGDPGAAVAFPLVLGEALVHVREAAVAALAQRRDLDRAARAASVVRPRRVGGARLEASAGSRARGRARSRSRRRRSARSRRRASGSRPRSRRRRRCPTLLSITKLSGSTTMPNQRQYGTRCQSRTPQEWSRMPAPGERVPPAVHLDHAGDRAGLLVVVARDAVRQAGAGTTAARPRP